MASTLYHLDLFQDLSIKGLLSIYEFTPTNSKKFSAGIYLSQKNAEEIEDQAVLFLEESKELEKTLDHVGQRKNKRWNKVTLPTKGESPLRVSQKALDLLLPYMENAKNCQQVIDHYGKMIENVQAKLSQPKAKVQKSKPVYFFMGEWKNSFPNTNALMIFQEGFIKDLISAGFVTEYPKHLAQNNYAPWSSKLLLDSTSLWIGINSKLLFNETLSNSVEKITPNRYQVRCKACLIPGIFQVEWLGQLLESELFSLK